MHFKITHTEILEKKAERSPKEPYFKGKISGRKLRCAGKILITLQKYTPLIQSCQFFTK